MLQMIGDFVGGLGFFLLAVSMISEGLRLAAGSALRDVLTHSTRTPLRGILSGVFLTALVQSSSVVTIATIGFVNAGLLRLPQSLGIILGATVGTTMTGWLVAAIGFQFKISTFALPLVGIGMLLRLIGPSRRAGALGEAIAGFGLFFIGVDFLKGGFEGAVQNFDIAAFTPEGILGLLLFLGVGVLMTMLTQSSSVTVAITMTAATGGLIGFVPAMAMTIGATIGTTSTSALAVIGATPSAKRVAAAHVIINSWNGMVGLALMPGIIWLIRSSGVLGDERSPALVLALFHTSFNVLGLLLIVPFLGRLSAFLEQRFRSQAEEIGKPQHLDANIMASPRLALDAFYLELKRMEEMTRRHAHAALSNQGEVTRELLQQHDGLQKLVRSVEHFVATLETERLHKSVAVQLPLILRISNYIDETVTQAQENAAGDTDVEFLLGTPLREPIENFQQAVLAHIDRCDPSRPDFVAEALELEYQSLRVQWRALKTVLLDAGVNRQIPLARLNPAIESLRLNLRVAERCTRTAVRMNELAALIPELALAPA